MSPKIIDESVILSAAAEEFAEMGFNGARVDSIAKRANVNKAMLYYRVGDKKELYRRVVLNGQKSIQTAIMNALSTSNTAPDAIVAILKGITENVAENRLIPSIILREISGSGKTLPEEALKGISKFMGTIKSVVKMGIEEGTFRDIDSITLQFIITSAIFTMSLTTQLRQNINPENPGPLTAETITDSINDILLNGILKEGTV